MFQAWVQNSRRAVLRKSHRSRKSRRKVARYFGSHVRGASAIDHQERLQLWKGDKRRDHTLAWTHAVSSRAFSGDGEAPTVGGMEHIKQRVSTDFLPVTPVVAPVDERATNGTTAEQDGVQTESLEQWVARKTKEFNLATRERPESDDIWLQYADFQEDAVRALHGEKEAAATAVLFVKVGESPTHLRLTLWN